MPISFSGNAKEEICKSFPQKRCCALAQCFGILLYSNSFHNDGIKIITESHEFALILPKLFKKAFALSFDMLPELDTGKQVFQITEPDKIKQIMESYGFNPASTLSLHINLPIVEDDCCKAAFLRGVFLAGGSVTDPSKGYHMELATMHQSVTRENYTLIQEVMGFAPKITQRGGAQVLYLKNSEQIADFLTFLGAPIAAMGIMEARLEKELNNEVNRRCNCDDANTSKVVAAAQEQLAAIHILQEQGKLDSLPDKIYKAAAARLAYPSASLTELAAMMEPPITKAAMNNRMKKLTELTKEILS